MRGARAAANAHRPGPASTPRSGRGDQRCLGGSAAVPGCAESRRLGAALHLQPQLLLAAPSQGRASFLGQCPAGTPSPEAEPAPRAGPTCVFCSRSSALGSARCPGMRREDLQAAHCRRGATGSVLVHAAHRDAASPVTRHPLPGHSTAGHTPVRTGHRSSDKHGAWVPAAPVPAATVARIPRHRQLSDQTWSGPWQDMIQPQNKLKSQGQHQLTPPQAPGHRWMQGPWAAEVGKGHLQLACPRGAWTAVTGRMACDGLWGDFAGSVPRGRDSHREPSSRDRAFYFTL